MAAEPEIHRVRNDPDEARAMSKFLLGAYQPVLSDWEADFLDDMMSKKFEEGLSYRQAEKLLQIRDDCHSVTHHRGLSVRILLQKCSEGRLDLSEGNEDFIARLCSRNSDSIRSRDLPRLLDCAYKLDLIEPHMLIKAPTIDYAAQAERASTPPSAPSSPKRERVRSAPAGGLSR